MRIEQGRCNRTLLVREACANARFVLSARLAVDVRQEERIIFMNVRKRLVFVLIGLSCFLAGCSTAPESLGGSAWKLISLTTPMGTEYDETAYDMIIGETVYRFGTDGSLVTSIGDEEEQLTYRYSYEKGRLEISSEELQCTGTVNAGELVLKLGERGEAVFAPLEAE